MRLSLVGGALLALGFAFAGPALAQEDADGSKDHPLLNRMANYFIFEYQARDFDSDSFEVRGAEPVVVEGKKTFIEYRIRDEAEPPSALAVMRNHQAALKRLGGQVLFEDTDGNYAKTTIKVERDGKEVWAGVVVGENGGYYRLTIVERKGMKQEVVADAAAWGADIAKTGHVAVYGILFDTDKAEVKPESAPALAEIARLLAADPALKLFVVGHTDAAGDLAHNMKLSHDRAAAVAAALVAKHGVAASRLFAQGAGPLAPVASNADEQGRAKNRRVELVKR